MNVGSRQNLGQDNAEPVGGYERYFALLETDYEGKRAQEPRADDGWELSAYERFLDGEERLFDRD